MRLGLLPFLLLLVMPLQARGEEPRCRNRPESFPGVEVRGEFAHDRGCIWTGFRFGGKSFEGLKQSGAVLTAQGFSGDPNKAAALALAWVADVLYASEVLTSAPEGHFHGSGAPQFTAPKVEPTGDGGVRVRCWRRQPSGMSPMTTYDRIEVVFSPSGDVQGVKVVQTYSAR